MDGYESPGALLARHGLRPKKSWGQNFLADREVQERIARLVDPRPGETVVELGAGLGHLTSRLVGHGARVVAVERDRELAPVLRAELCASHPELEVVEADAATFDFALVARQTGPVTVCGNLPYHLGSPILFHLLDLPAAVRRMVLMLQREVVERIVARPGTPEYGLLSVLLNEIADCQLALHVPRGAFVPPPEVDSAVLVATVLERPRAPVESPERFRKLVKAAFAQRRKTLRNALRPVAEPARIERAAKAVGVDLTRRGETLSVEEFAALERALAATGADQA